jgi:hypothetical protein
MSRKHGSTSLPLATAPIAGAIVLGGVLLAVTLGLLAVGDPLSAPATGGLALASALGFVIVTIALCRVIRRLAAAAGSRHGDDGEGGGEGGREPGPRPPSDEPDWWPQFERDLCAYLEAHERYTLAAEPRHTGLLRN